MWKYSMSAMELLIVNMEKMNTIVVSILKVNKF